MADRTVSVKLKADVASYMASMKAAGQSTRDVEKAARDVRRAHDEEADAAGAVRVAEAQLAEVRGKGSAKTSELAAAEERLAKAHRSLQSAREKTATAEQSFLQLQEKAGAEAGDAFGKGYEKETSKVAKRANAQFGAMLAAGLAVGGGAAAGVGALVSAAAIAGTTAALLGFGVSVAATDQKVQFAVGDMNASINKDMKDISSSLKGPVIESAGRLRDAFHDMAPELKRDMAALAPAVDQLTSGIINGARAALPGISALARSSEPVFRGLRVMMEDAGAGFTDFATQVAGSSGAVEKDLDILGRVIGSVFSSLGGVVSNLASNTQAVDVFGRIIEEAAHTLELLTANGGAAMSALGAFGGTAAGLINVLNGVLSVLNMLPSGMTEIIGMLVAGGAAAKALGFNMTDAFTKSGASATGFKAKLGAAVAALTVVGAVMRTFVSDVKRGQTSVDGLSDALTTWQKTGVAGGDAVKLFSANMQDLGDTFTVLKNDQDGWLEGFTDFVGNFIGMDSRLDDAKSRIQQLDDALSSMVRNNNGAEASQVIQKIADQTGRSVAEVTAMLPQFQAAQKEAANSTQQNASAIKDLGARAQAAAKAIDTLLNSLNNLVQPQLDAREAARGLEQAIDDASQAIGDNGKTLDVTTEKGRNNQAALDGIASSTNNLVQAMVKGGKSQREIAAAMDEGRQSFINAATAMGMPKQAAEDLATQLGLIDSKQWNVAMGANVSNATDQVNSFLAFASAQSATAKVFGDTNPAMGSVKDWQNVTNQTDGNTTTYTYTDPATQAVTQWKVTTDATGAKTTTYSFTDPANGAVYSWKQMADGTWATVNAGADTRSAESAINNAARNRSSTIYVNTVFAGAHATGSSPAGARGGIATPMAKGGVLGMASGGGLRPLTPMSSVAGVVPANSWRVIGDRMRGKEYYIPADGSQRSQRILAEANADPLLGGSASTTAPINAVQQVIRSGDAVKSSPTSLVSASSSTYNFSFPNYVGSREELVKQIRETVRIKGGDVQKVFGR